MRRSASEKMEIIKIVSESEIGPTRTLEELGISRSTFYDWYDKYLKNGFDGLLPKTPSRRSFWNKIPEEERQEVVDFALDHAQLTPRELAYKITDEKAWYISESSVYRILKERGLITSPAWIVMSAADEFKDKTTGPNQLWQTDFTYMKIVGWGWYYLATVIDDYSRYIVHWELCKYQKKEDAERVVSDAIIKSGLPPNKRPKLLSDNGPCYIAAGFDEYLASMGVKHIRGRKLHPQTQGKIERYHRTMKNVIKLENYYYPEELEQRIKEFVNYYNNERYHESINNVTPADSYYRRDKEILRRREIIKTKTLAERKLNNQIAC